MPWLSRRDHSLQRPTFLKFWIPDVEFLNLWPEPDGPCQQFEGLKIQRARQTWGSAELSGKEEELVLLLAEMSSPRVGDHPVLHCCGTRLTQPKSQIGQIDAQLN